MEIKDFEKARNKRLGDFESHYDYLKQQYTMSLQSAIQEKRAAEQEKLTQQVLQINSDMTNEIRQIITELSQTPDSSATDTKKQIDELTNDLIQYQSEYQKIVEGKDRVQTLKMIYAKDSEKLKQTTTMYNIYLGALIVVTIFVAYLVLRTSWTPTIFASPMIYSEQPGMSISPIIFLVIIGGALYYFWPQISSYFK